MVKLIITSKNDNQEDIAKNAKGGTELMRDKLYSLFPTEILDKFQIICSRPNYIDPNKITILWCHDLAHDPAVSKLKDTEYQKQFAAFVFVSNWQMEQYHNVLNIPYNKCMVIPNAIDEIDMHMKPRDKIKLIYTPTPHRGLNILVTVFNKLCEAHSNIELDVYSSFKLYGWEQRDEEYKHIFNYCKDHPKINYHGTVSNEQVQEALKQAHIFAYPCIWPETSCRCIMEAMSARCLILNPNLAALPETTGCLTPTYQWVDDVNEHANIFYKNLNDLINIVKDNGDSKELTNYLNFIKSYADTRYNWNAFKSKWDSLFTLLLKQEK